MSNHAKITVLGAGIAGMAIASQLPKGCDITIVGRNLPGDAESLEWSSPWAGAVWMGKDPSEPWEQTLQLESFYQWWKLAYSNPESSVRRIQMVDLIDQTPLDKVWYRGKLPDFRTLNKDEMPSDSPPTMSAMTYGNVVITPAVFLVWLRKRLETNNVKFVRMHVSSLSDLKGLGHDVLINATGNGARHLKDSPDLQMQPVRGQTVLVRTNFDKIWIRRGKEYTYVLPRTDGTAIMGGFKHYNSTDTNLNEAMRIDIFRRVHENLPQSFPSPDPKDFDVVRDIVGIRPERSSGVRIEKEVIDGQNVVHAYGHQGMFILAWGVANKACQLVQEFLYEHPTTYLKQAKL